MHSHCTISAERAIHIDNQKEAGPVRTSSRRWRSSSPAALLVGSPTKWSCEWAGMQTVSYAASAGCLLCPGQVLFGVKHRRRGSWQQQHALRTALLICPRLGG